MANPAPTINQINAFNATQGTTIDFNIIGGTEVIRSNKIYIYDLSDNSLICTHLYVSTESIHELPPNTSSSIVYESGKSSADFTNNTQYYAQIQTFTDVGGTQGASGLSIAKLFWCLPTPTLTLSTIPTTISTTSYNVSATYTPNTSGSATNEIQEFQFNLYSAIGALLQTSGVVLYGEGVDLSYNFSGLEVDSTYYVTLDVTTTQGMNVSVQSNTFTVSIDTPTMGSASVVNNGCDGYISVTSNLSSEYEHEESVDSGEIMSFTTDSVNDITELDVDFSPIQDGTPWMSAQDTEPYMFRPVPTQTEDFGHESDTIVGGTVGWNQLLEMTSTTVTSYGVTFERSDDVKISYSGTFTGTDYLDVYVSTSIIPNRFVVGHRYLIGAVSSDNRLFIVINNPYTDGRQSTSKQHIYTPTSQPTYFYVRCLANTNEAISGSGYAYIIDLTAYFGSTIADYVYTLESGTAGAGVAWLKENAPQLFEYHAYDAGSLVSVSGLTSHDMVGFNQFDKSTSTAGKRFGSSGMVLIDRATGSVSDYIKVLPNIVYYAKNVSGSAQGNTIVFYDADKSWIGTVDIGTYTSASGTFTTPNNCAYIRFQYETVNENTVCINLSNTSLNGTYKPYVKHSYPLDSALTLRGIPKLDASNNLYYDGDVYESDGSVTRKYGIVDLGTLNWMYVSSATRPYFRTQTDFASIKPSEGSGTKAPMVCSKYPVETWTHVLDTDGYDKHICEGWKDRQFIAIRDDSYTDATTFKSAMSGAYLVYELATPTTETADPYTNPQIVDPSGTEEYVGSPIPVGHNTTYQRICPITGWTGCEVSQAGVNLFDKAKAIEMYCDGSTKLLTNTTFKSVYVLLAPNATYTYKQTVSGTYVRLAVCNSLENLTPIYSPLTKTAGYETATSLTFTNTDFKYLVCTIYRSTSDTKTYDEIANSCMLKFGSTATDYVPYNPNSAVYPVSWQTEAGTVYGGTLTIAIVDGEPKTWVTVEYAETDLSVLTYNQNGANCVYANITLKKSGSQTSWCDSLQQVASSTTVGNMPDGSYKLYSNNSEIAVKKTGILASTAAQTLAGIKLVYELATPTTYQLTPTQIQTLLGQNNVWNNINGGMSIIYQLPITDLLVKRRDVADVSGKWLTLYSTPITQADDMDFTFIDFLNQYGKTYQYALVPVLAQDQSGVVVQIEGGYTVSDNVDSIFDGVYIADQTNVERVKAGVGYGNIDMNQGVGSITPIGSKYPIVITNSRNQYHNGSIRGTIVPNDFYSNGNLSRIDMVNKRDELEQFLTNKRAKIIKDWNGKMWLVMIMSNVACSFDDNYGMGMVSFSADWLEVGDPTNQQDLYNAGLINVGGV